MRAEVYTTIHDIVPAIWDQATAGYPFLSWQWMADGEAIVGETAAFYVLVFDADQVLAGACLYVEHEMVLPYISSRLIKGALRRFLQRYPPIVCKSPEPINRSGLFFRSESVDVRNEALKHILSAAEEIARQVGASFVHIDYIDDADLDLNWQDWLKSTDSVDVGTVLDLAGIDTFEQYQYRYLNAKRRKNIRHDQERAESGGLSVYIEDTVPEDVIPGLIDLILQVNALYDVDTYPFMDHIMRHLGRYQGGYWIYVTDRDGHIVGTEFLFFDPQTRMAVPILFGHDQTTRDVYMITYYSELRYVIETLGADRLIGGSGKLDFKFRLGFRHETSKNMIYYARSGFLRWLGRTLNQLPIWQEDDLEHD